MGGLRACAGEGRLGAKAARHRGLTRACGRSGCEDPVLFHRGRAVVPVQDLAEADQLAVEGGIDGLGEDQVEYGFGGLGR